MGERVTRGMLESRVDLLNKLLKANNIEKEYTVGYRNGSTALDELSPTNPDCILRSIAYGTKTEVSGVVMSICSVLR